MSFNIFAAVSAFPTSAIAMHEGAHYYEDSDWQVDEYTDVHGTYHVRWERWRHYDNGSWSYIGTFETFPYDDPNFEMWCPGDEWWWNWDEYKYECWW